jgi:CBS domain-containing protein
VIRYYPLGLRTEASMQIREIMTRNVKLISPQDSIRDAARRMRDEDIGSLPVADGDRLVGYLTDRDIVIRAIADSGGADSPVRDAMSERVLYCFEDESVDDVARNMAENQVRRLPVLTREKRLCGVVALGDLAAHADEPAEKALEGISRPAH